MDAKVNAVERLRVEAPRKARGRVLLSSVTDPYQPLEKRYELTRRLLVVLRDNGYPIEILTKSDLVTRDADIVTEFDEAEVGLTVTALDDRVRRSFEPGASPVEARLRALKEFSERGIPTYAFLGPMIPYLSDEGLGELLDALADRVGRLMVDRLNIKCGNLPLIRAVLKDNYPDLATMFEEALPPTSAYYANLRAKVMEMCRQRSIPVEVVY